MRHRRCEQHDRATPVPLTPLRGWGVRGGRKEALSGDVTRGSRHVLTVLTGGPPGAVAERGIAASKRASAGASPSRSRPFRGAEPTASVGGAARARGA